VRAFWDYIQIVLSQFFSIPVDVLRFHYLLWGVSFFNQCKAQQVLILGFALWTIFRVHNAAIFNDNLFSTNILIFTFKHLLSSHLSVLAYTAKCNNYLNTFNSK